MNVTIFSTCKPFAGPIATAQHNAIRSWKALEAEVILLDNEEGTEEAAREHGCLFIPNVARNSQGLPMMASLFALAEQAATGDLLCYANADIVLLSDFADAVQAVRKQLDRFLIISHRINLRIEESLSFPDDESTLRLKAKMEGYTDVPCAIDIFCYTRGLYPEIPDFVHARRAWDNWLVWDVLHRRLPVVDATSVMTVIHQTHDQYRPSTDPNPAREHNRRLLSKLAGRPITEPIGFISHASYRLDGSGSVVSR